MLKNRTLSLFIFGMLLFSKSAFSQESCTHVVKASHPSPLISYLSEKYGEENAEQLTINISKYEMKHDVTVLCEAEFKATITRLEQILTNATDFDEKNRLNESIARIILLNTIEALIQ